MSEEKKNGTLNENELDSISGGQLGDKPGDYLPRKESTYTREPKATGKFHAADLGAIVYSWDSEKPFYYCEKCHECHWTLEEFTVLNIKAPTLDA